MGGPGGGGGMSSLVERLRVRSEKRPLYTLDESDDDLPPRGGGGKGRDRHSDGPTERIEREDAVWRPIRGALILFSSVFGLSCSDF